MARIIAERAGFAPDTNAEDHAEPGLDVAPADAPAHEIGFASERTR
jgi:hypothetical protein